MTQASTAEAAQRYLARGWAVLPLRAQDKRPLVSWEPLQTARPSAQQVTDWFNRWPNANIGIITGEISNLVVLDIDPKHGGDVSRERRERQFGLLPATVEAVTGGAGCHLFNPPRRLDPKPYRAGAGHRSPRRRRVCRRAAVYPSQRRSLRLGHRPFTERNCSCGSTALDLDFVGWYPRQADAFGLASTGPRRSARGSTQFEHRFVDRTSVVAPGRPGRGAGTASRGGIACGVDRRLKTPKSLRLFRTSLGFTLMRPAVGRSRTSMASVPLTNAAPSLVTDTLRIDNERRKTGFDSSPSNACRAACRRYR